MPLFLVIIIVSTFAALTITYDYTKGNIHDEKRAETIAAQMLIYNTISTKYCLQNLCPNGVITISSSYFPDSIKINNTGSYIEQGWFQSLYDSSSGLVLTHLTNNYKPEKTEGITKQKITASFLEIKGNQKQSINIGTYDEASNKLIPLTKSGLNNEFSYLKTLSSNFAGYTIPNGELIIVTSAKN